MDQNHTAPHQTSKEAVRDELRTILAQFSPVKDDSPRLNLIAAMTEDRAIGNSNGLAYSNRADMGHFKAFTKGHAVIMGSATAKSLNGPLKGRVNLVISRKLKADELGPGFYVYGSPAEALTSALRLGRPLTVVGGETIYDLFLGVADRLVLTYFAHSVARADRWFPSTEGLGYVDVAKVKLAADTTVVYSRLSAP